VINTGPPFKMARITGNRVKAEQLFGAKTKGAEVLVAPCHNCHSGLHDIVQHYEIGLDIKFFGDIIYEVMEKPA
jgi:heterodisulfide reductase subunit B